MDGMSSNYKDFVADAYAKYGHEGLNFPRKKTLTLASRLAGHYKPQNNMLSLMAGHFKAQKGRPLSPICEFGVYKGRSINHLASLFPDNQVIGFDSFAGFPDDNRCDWQQDFATPMPRVKNNVQLMPGFFDQTLPAWKAENKDLQRIDLMHIDCDIYSSTKTVFDNLEEWLVEGSVIFFDELINYDHFLNNEMLALYEFLERTDLSFKWFVSFGELCPLEYFQARKSSRRMREYRAQGYFQQCAIELVTR